MPANLENSEVATGLEKVSFHFNPKERQCQRKVKPLHNVTQFHMLGRLCSESFKLGFNSMWTENFQMHKWGFEEAKEPEFKLTTFFVSWRKQGSFRETPTNSASLTTLRSLTEWITTNCGKFLKRWEYRTTLPASWEIYMRVKKQKLELDTEQLIGSKLGKSTSRLYIVTMLI